MPTSRLEMFSDGVFAIAITILILDLKAPDDTTHLLRSLLALWPSYLGYVLSFLLIGLLWVNHHVMFEHIVRGDRLLGAGLQREDGLAVVLHGGRARMFSC